MKLGNRTLLGGFVVVAGLLLIGEQTPHFAFAQQKGGKQQQNVPSFKSDAKFLAAFRDSVAAAAKSTVRIQCDGKDAALGVVVSPDGFILTKATLLADKITVKLPNGEELPAKLVGIHAAHDLAMLKVNARKLTPIEFTDSKVASVGNFVASVGTGADPVAVGVVSVAARNMPAVKAPKGGGNPTGGYLGVVTEDHPQGAKVSSIAAVGKGGKGGKGGGGFGGGNPSIIGKIKEGDIIVAIDGTPIKGTESLKSELQKHKGGQEIALKLIRGDEEVEMKLKLNTPPVNRGDVQNNMGSELSKRRDGFPVVLQHDSVVRPVDCGGPLCDLEGHVIGLNIARAGRVESHTIPSEVIKPLLADLMSGKLAPK